MEKIVSSNAARKNGAPTLVSSSNSALLSARPKSSRVRCESLKDTRD